MANLAKINEQIINIVSKDHLCDMADIVCHFYTGGREEIEVNLFQFLSESSELERSIFTTIIHEVESKKSASFLKEAYDIIQIKTDEYGD